MLVVGLTGGIGSGKSTVSALLAAKGAVVVDADAVTRELQQPGTPVFAAMVERFGPGIVAGDGTLDRAAVADIVFTDPQALRDLNDIVHPAVGAGIAERMAALAGTDEVVILDVPLMVESTRGYPVAGLVVVDVDPEVALQRLVGSRGTRTPRPPPGPRRSPAPPPPLHEGLEHRCGTLRPAPTGNRCGPAVAR